MKRLALFFIFVLIFITFPGNAGAIYDPLSKPNNIFGIHILYPEEVSQASSLVNSSGGDWGYITIPIQASDRDLEKWQKFMDECAKYHLIPIVRLATVGDYFSKASWSIPTDNDVLDFANFLNSLNWPTKNRYIIVFNEPNRGDEWGGAPDAASYAQILDYAVTIFKEENPDFFIISAGLDNASSNIEGISVDDFSFMYQMDSAVPGIFGKIDGLSSHSYPNPGFSQPPNGLREGINSFFYQDNTAFDLSGKKLPVFITETGWSSDKVSLDIQAKYYIDAFNNYWKNTNVVAVTPFVFGQADGSFAQFSFLKNEGKNTIYANYINFPKVKGKPAVTINVKTYLDTSNKNLPTEKFNINESINSVFNHINSSSKVFFKWLLKA
jgi:hypothetical protein